MSADNGTYILWTEGPEFRIKHFHAVDNLYGQYIKESRTWTPNCRAIVEAFSSSQVFTSLDEAWDEAMKIDASQSYSEYGTNMITDFSAYTFDDLSDQATRG